MKILKYIFVLLISSSFVIAQSEDDVNKKASYLINKHEYKKAYLQLDSLYTLGSYNNQTLYLLGLSSYKLGDIKKAIEYYELLLEQDNGANRVRLDLAKCYYDINNLQKAKELLLYVKNTNPPQNVQDNIDQFLEQISQKSRTKFTVFAKVGYLYDSNANAGPEEENAPDLIGAFYSKATDDTAFTYGTNLNYIVKDDEIMYQNSFGVSKVDYQRLDYLDELTGYFSSSVLFQKNKIRYVLPVVLNAQKIGHDSRYYSKWIDFRPKMSYQYNKNTTFNLQTLFSQKTYYKNSDRKTNIFSITPSSRYFLDGTSYVDTAIEYMQENSKTQSLSYKQKGFNIGYFKAYTKLLNLYLNLSYARLDYESDLNRLDKKYNINANLSYAISASKLYGVLGLVATKDQSNYAIFDYERVKLSLNFIYKF